jgi:hypothetical protein
MFSSILKPTRWKFNWAPVHNNYYPFVHLFIYDVTYLSKASIVEPEKQPLLANGRETNNRKTSVARQQFLDLRQFNKQEGNGIISAVRAELL